MPLHWLEVNGMLESVSSVAEQVSRPDHHKRVLRVREELETHIRTYCFKCEKSLGGARTKDSRRQVLQHQLLAPAQLVGIDLYFPRRKLYVSFTRTGHPRRTPHFA